MGLQVCFEGFRVELNLQPRSSQFIPVLMVWGLGLRVFFMIVGIGIIFVSSLLQAYDK